MMRFSSTFVTDLSSIRVHSVLRLITPSVSFADRPSAFRLSVSRTAGGICGTALVLWNMVTYKTWYGFVNVSPVSWVNLSRVDYDGSSIYPSLTYILLALLALFAALSAASWVTLRRRNIDVLKSV